MKLILFVLSVVVAQIHAISWQGDWAMNCGFPDGNDIKGVATESHKCGGVCESTNGCTHFVYIIANGMCYLKSGNVGKDRAFDKHGAVCGVAKGNSGNSGNNGNNGQGESKGKGKILWQDEFNGSGAPSDNWDAVLQGFNNEYQRYTNMENLWKADGKLVIEGKKKNGEWTSARIWTKKTFQYGYFESRIQFAQAHGGWGAFWLLPKYNANWPVCGEIDIVEFAANDRGWTQSNPISSKHNQNGAGQKLVGQIIDDAQYTFHTYAVDWTPTSLKFYFDGQLVKDPDHPHNSVYSRWGNEDGGWPYDKPFSIVLNLAIGGDMALQGGPLVEGDFWNPEMRKMYVDYVRVHDNGFNQIH